MPGTLFVVATPIGNLEDVTVRALRILREVSVIAAEDTRRTAHLLTRYGITTPTTSLHEHNESKKGAALIERLRTGDSVALVSDAGTPTVSDPGSRLIRAAHESRIRVEPIPGPSAALAALSASGLASDTFLFLGFPPTRSKARKLWFESARTAGRTVVFFESPHRIKSTLSELKFAAGDCRVVVARELTKTHEELVEGPISVVLKTGLKAVGEFTVVAEIGLITESKSAAAVGPESMAGEFRHLTETGGLSRKSAIARLAATHGLPRNVVYKQVETGLKLVE